MSAGWDAGVEIPLRGGRITDGVVRVGDTVRRPVGEHSAFVHRLLRHYEQVGCAAAPRLLGIDERGREVLSFQHGEVTTEFMAREWSVEQLVAAGKLLRRLHDAAAGAEVAGDAETVCHNDFSPLNVVFVDGLPAAAFDFDQARPGERLRDIAYAAWLWLLGAAVDDRLDGQVALLGVFLDAYGSIDRAGLGGRIVARVEDERDMHQRAGRGGGLTWLHDEIAWLRRMAPVIDGKLAAL